MMTPISSMQNALAVNYLTAAGYTVSFGEFMCISVPFCSLCVLLSWLYLMVVINPDDVEKISAIVYERGNMFSNRNIIVMIFTIVTIIFFAVSSLITGEIGDIGVISLIFISIMFGSGILTEVDFNSLSWHTLFLIGGGNVLGTAVSSSGLLDYISADITTILPMNFFWSAMFCILLFAMLVGTFVSHTVAAIMLLPIIVELASTLDDTIGIVICSTFAISAAMALPFSSFPNVNSFLVVDDFQRPYLSVTDFIQTGLPVSIITLLLISTFAFALIRSIFV
jgi:phosphate transporter